MGVCGGEGVKGKTNVISKSINDLKSLTARSDFEIVTLRLQFENVNHTTIESA